MTGAREGIYEREVPWHTSLPVQGEAGVSLKRVFEVEVMSEGSDLASVGCCLQALSCRVSVSGRVDVFAGLALVQSSANTL